MRAADRMGIAVIFSVVLATFPLTPLTADLSFLGISWLLILILGVATIALRRARIGSGSVLGFQLLILVMVTFSVSASMPGRGEPWFWHINALWQAGIEHIRTSAAPMAPNDGVKLILVTVIGVIMIMTDLLVSGIGRPVWGIAPPAALFLVPAIGLANDTGVFHFLCIALGYLAILVAEGLNSTARWTRGLARDSAEGFGTAMPVVWRAAAYLGIPALVGVLVLGQALPTLALPGFGFGYGPGGNGPLQLTDPTLDIRRNLTQPNDRPVIEYQTDAAGGVYLRLASLPQFGSNGWTSVQIRLDSGTTLPAIPGAAGQPDEPRNTTIQVLDFRSQYLPMPYAPRKFDAPGDWRFDANSLIVVNGNDRPDALRNLTYKVESIDIKPDVADLDKAPVGTPPDAAITAAVPRDLPQSISNLTLQVTKDADTPTQKAAAIQTYLRSSGFTYSTEPLPGSGYSALENFLLRDRKGYCEQFAAAMAVMARVAGIPSRVSVGFLPGHQSGDLWEVSIRDMHAWPELYFAGYGWVRFEPTPGSVTGSAPPWTVASSSGAGDDPSADPSSEASGSSAGESAPASTAPTTPSTPTTEQDRFWTGPRTALGAGIGLLLLLILAAPATLRVRRRTARLSSHAPADEQVESAWAEIRDTVIDYGGGWPDGSPRTIGDEIGAQLDHPESAAMASVATLVERSRYARVFTDDDAARELPRVTEDIRKGIAAPQGLRRKVLAFVLPRSIFRRSPQD
jgi:TgpA N-terminal domain/Transglutaminase-like superfamily